MHVDQLTRAYSEKTDEELLQLAADVDLLTPEAETALKSELARRHLVTTERFGNPDLANHRTKPRRIPSLPMTGVSDQVGGFVSEILRSYQEQVWLFTKLTFPAVALGCMAVLVGRNEAREISRHLGRGLDIFEHKTELVEIALANFGGLLASWTVFTLSFAGICVAVQKLSAGQVPSTGECFAPVRARIGRLLRLSSVLFVMLLVIEAFSLFLLEFGVIWVLERLPIHVSGFLILTTTYVCSFLGLLVMSRFSLSVPALVVDDLKVAEAIFRSDEYTERSWLILASLLAKSLVGGYVAGMIPFWIAGSLFATLPWPSWFPWALTAASILAVTLVEPPMFIGFALLYARRSKLTSASGSAANCKEGTLVQAQTTRAAGFPQ